MNNITTDGTHLITPEGDITTPKICIISGTPLPKKSKPTTVKFTHYTEKPKLPKSFLTVLFISSALAILSFLIFLNTSLSGLLLFTILIILATAVVISLAVTDFKYIMKQLHLQAHLTKKQKFLNNLPYYIPPAIYIGWITIYYSIIKISDQPPPSIYLILPACYILQWLLKLTLKTPTKTLKLTKFQNNLFHITGAHPNLLKTLPTNQKPSSCKS